MNSTLNDGEWLAMSSEFTQRDENDNEDVPWDDIVYYEEQQDQTIHLEGSDYIAIFIAALQTIFLPCIAFMVILVAIAIVLPFIF
jgi:co-chaperonin GroES (HSP10)